MNIRPLNLFKMKNSKTVHLFVFLFLFLILFLGIRKQNLIASEKFENKLSVNVSAQIDKPFGIVFPQKGSDYIKDLGAQNLRVIVPWEKLEPTKGNYYFSKLESALNNYAGQDIELVFTFNSYNPWGGFMGQKTKGNHRLSGYPKDEEAWLAMVKTTVEKLRLVNYWQVENEYWAWEDTEENYIKHLKATAQAIKSVNPNAKVLLVAQTAATPLAFADGYIAGRDKLFVDKAKRRVGRDEIKKNYKYKKQKEKIEFLLKNGAAYFDVLDIHIYVEDPYLVAGTIKWFQDEAKKFGVNKPIFVTEGASPNSNSYTVKKHAENLIKQHMFTFISGVQKFHMWTLFPIPKEQDIYNNLALLDSAGNKKPAYYTYKLMTEKLSGMTRITQIGDTKDVYVFEFTDGNKKVYVAWSVSGSKSFKLDSPKDARITHIITEYNRTAPELENIDSEKGKINLILTEEPIFVEL